MGKGKIETERFVPARMVGGAAHGWWFEYDPGKFSNGKPVALFTLQGQYKLMTIRHPDRGKTDVYSIDGTLQGQPPVVVRDFESAMSIPMEGVPVTLRYGRFAQYDIFVPRIYYREYVTIEVHHLSEYPEDFPALYMSCRIESPDRGRTIEFWEYEKLSMWLNSQT